MNALSRAFRQLIILALLLALSVAAIQASGLGDRIQFRVLRLFGQQYFRVGVDTALQGSPVVSMDLANSAICDDDVRQFKSFPQLQFLNLDSNRLLSDTGFASLEDVAGLESLSLYNTNADDAIFGHLQKLLRLRKLNLGHVKGTGPIIIGPVPFTCPEVFCSGSASSQGRITGQV